MRMMQNSVQRVERPVTGQEEANDETEVAAEAAETPETAEKAGNK